MTHRVAVIGTGTGVGKTSLTVGWAGHLRACGVTAGAWKPIETGGLGDARALVEASGRGDVTDTVALATPASPHRAARLEGRRIDFAERRDVCDRLSTGLDVLLIEGAGGAFTPVVDATGTVTDLMLFLGVTATVLVATDRLGALHDVVAVARAARGALHLRAVVLNAFGAAPEIDLLENEAELRTLFPALLVLRRASFGPEDYVALSERCFT
ncbi:MAG: dethiobiotin synthase [Polyangiales bacterium]